MKKAYQSLKYKRYSAQRTRRQEKERNRAKKRRRGISTQPKRNPQKAPIRVVAPINFSFINNCDETIQFFIDLEKAFAKTSKYKYVFIDLRDITEMTPEVIVALISKIDKEKEKNHRSSSGNVPRNEVARNMLASSGFYKYVKTRAAIKEPSYGTIENYDGRSVASDKAAQLIDKAAELLTMTSPQEDGHQSTAVECMTNTLEHASGRLPKGNEKWWFSVYCDPKNGIGQFSFVDVGIGIFVSLEKHQFKWFGAKPRSDILKMLLAGQTADKSLSQKKRTSTRKGYRGRGLPNIANRNRLGHTRRLIIISNDVYANVEDGKYHLLEQEFKGTIICWEHQVTGS